MIKRSIIIIFVFILLAFSFHCKKKEPELSPEITTNDEKFFNLGTKYLKKNEERGRLYLRQLIDTFPKSFYAQRAKLAIADSYFESNKAGSMILATSEYREFISLYPSSPSVPYAQYQIAMTFYERMLKPGCDQTNTKKALEEFQKLVSEYPLSDEAELAKEKMEKCEEYLAEHIFRIGKYYYKVDAYKASVSRLNDILTKYPQYSKMDEVFYLLGDSYYRWEKVDESIPYFRKVISDYPNSKYAKKAKKILDEIEENK
ncbi:MAG: outer membrane protein assembly factor BamD [Candidatus Aminicenantaceae bacterium]